MSMNDRERFKAIMNYGDFERIPCWFFGTWKETQERWRAEGWAEGQPIGEATGMDVDWERGNWSWHGLVDYGPAPVSGKSKLIEDAADYQVVEHPDGSVVKQNKRDSSPPHYLKHPLEPTRESWERYRQRLDASESWRRPEGWRRKARALQKRERATCFPAGSLYGRLRGLMGMENLSLLMYDDPELFEEMVAHVADFYMQIAEPILEECSFEFGYFFEDCCFKNGPMFSPAIYRQHMQEHYRRMADFYHARGTMIMLDSDGKVDDLVGCWLESGVDIIFPIEVGTWKASPVKFRREYGRDMRMIGGVDKHVIPRGEAAIREHLAPLADLAAEGGYVPLPDHRIPPDCSLEQFRVYVKIFREMFGVEAVGHRTACGACNA
jgi:Uroporphyrinogen decarboxylase (URO-D)